MLTKINNQFGKGGTGLSDGTLSKTIRELQSIAPIVLTGVAASTNMAVAGIKTTDTITSAIMYASGVPSDITSTMSITSAGNVQSTAVTTGNKIVMHWAVKPLS